MFATEKYLVLQDFDYTFTGIVYGFTEEYKKGQTISLRENCRRTAKWLNEGYIKHVKKKVHVKKKR